MAEKSYIETGVDKLVKLIEEKKTKIKIIKVSKKLEEKKRLELQRLAQLNKELSAVEMRLSNVDFVVGRKRIITKVYDC